MSLLKMTTNSDIDDFRDELSDEALDRRDSELYCWGRSSKASGGVTANG